MIPADLKAWRQRHGYDQPAAAAALRTPLGTYRNWEQGRGPIPEIVGALCEALDGDLYT